MASQNPLDNKVYGRILHEIIRSEGISTKELQELFGTYKKPNLRYKLRWLETKGYICTERPASNKRGRAHKVHKPSKILMSKSLKLLPYLKLLPVNVFNDYTLRQILNTFYYVRYVKRKTLNKTTYPFLSEFTAKHKQPVETIFYLVSFAIRV